MSLLEVAMNRQNRQTNRQTRSQTNESMLIKKMVSILVLLGIVIMIVPTILFADLENAYVLGSNLGLVIKKGPESAMTDNLGPGDVVNSTMTLENDGSMPFEVYFKTNIKQGSESSPRGGSLADRLLIEIKSGERILVPQMSFREASELVQISIAQMAVGSKLVLDFEVSFPQSANNEYQGSTFQAYWTFVTVGNNQPTTESTSESTEPTESTESTESTEPTEPTESTQTTQQTEAFEETQAIIPTIPAETQAFIAVETEVIEEEDTPLGEVVTTESLDEIFDEPIPLDVTLPKTGQLAAFYFWLAGLSLIGVGIWLLYKNRF